MPEFVIQRPNGREDIIVSDSLAGAERDSGGAAAVELDDKMRADMEKKATKREAGADTDDSDDGKPSKSWSRDKLVAYLTEHGGTVADGDSKADILTAIEASS